MFEFRGATYIRQYYYPTLAGTEIDPAISIPCLCNVRLTASDTLRGFPTASHGTIRQAYPDRAFTIPGSLYLHVLLTLSSHRI